MTLPVVLARTPSWAIVAKPARLACHPSALVRDRFTLLRALRPRLHRKVHLVHRLDRAVSGCLLVTFDGPTCGHLHAALTGPGSSKVYVALVRGFFRWDDPVVVDADVLDEDGSTLTARSVVSCLGRSLEPRCSLLQIEPDTGRWHQVRRHCRDLGHPILGDSSHGDTRENRAWRLSHGLDRLALHALSLDLGIEHDGARVAAWCPLPADLAAIFRQLPWWEDAVAAEPRLAFPPMALDAEAGQR